MHPKKLKPLPIIIKQADLSSLTNISGLICYITSNRKMTQMNPFIESLIEASAEIENRRMGQSFYAPLYSKNTADRLKTGKKRHNKNKTSTRKKSEVDTRPTFHDPTEPKEKPSKSTRKSKRQKKSSAGTKGAKKEFKPQTFMPWSTQGYESSWFLQSQGRQRRMSFSNTKKWSLSRKGSRKGLRGKSGKKSSSQSKRITQAYYLQKFSVKKHPNYVSKLRRGKSSSSSHVKGSYLQIEEKIYVKVPSQRKMASTGNAFFKRKQNQNRSLINLSDSISGNFYHKRSGYKQIKAEFSKNLMNNRLKYQSSPKQIFKIRTRTKEEGDMRLDHITFKKLKDIKFNLNPLKKKPKKSEKAKFEVIKNGRKIKIERKEEAGKGKGVAKSSVLEAKNAKNKISSEKGPHQMDSLRSSFKSCNIVDLSSKFNESLKRVNKHIKTKKPFKKSYDDNSSKRVEEIGYELKSKLKDIVSGEKFEKKIFKNSELLKNRERENLTKINKNRLFYNLTATKFKSNSKNPFFMGPIKRLLCQYEDMSQRINKKYRSFVFDKNNVYMKRMFLETSLNSIKQSRSPGRHRSELNRHSLLKLNEHVNGGGDDEDEQPEVEKKAEAVDDQQELNASAKSVSNNAQT